jgi:hypothetical protein
VKEDLKKKKKKKKINIESSTPAGTGNQYHSKLT